MPAPIHEDDLKRRARRRLIGAVALTLVAVIVLPLMLEDDPPPAAHLQVHMPANNKTPDFVPIAPSLEPPPAPTQATVPDSAPAPDATSMTQVPREEPKPVVVERKPKPVVEQKPKPVVAAEVKKPTKPNPTPETGSKPFAEKALAYVVQLGAFSDAAKTADLKQRVDDLGMSSYTEKSGALIRVRVGPFSSREAAATAAAKLSAAGVQGQVMPK